MYLIPSLVSLVFLSFKYIVSPCWYCSEVKITKCNKSLAKGLWLILSYYLKISTELKISSYLNSIFNFKFSPKLELVSWLVNSKLLSLTYEQEILFSVMETSFRIEISTTTVCASMLAHKRPFKAIYQCSCWRYVQDSLPFQFCFGEHKNPVWHLLNIPLC